MKVNFYHLNLITAAIFSGMFSSSIHASDFNLPFVNTAGLGVVYADWATAAADASTAYTNPAGLVNLTNQQLVFVPLGILGNTRFTGTTITPSFPFPLTVTQTGSAGSHIGAFLPSVYYARPIRDNLTFGFGMTVPFALGTSYDKDSIVRYASTRSKVVAIDIGPSLGIRINDKFSVGLGLDAVRLAFTLNNMYGPPLSIPDAELQNNLSGWGYGWHGGVLYQIMPQTRLGVSFNSKVVLHTKGESKVYAPGAYFRTNDQKTDNSLPARAQLSLQHDLTPRWTVMATAFYTNWRTFEKITMERTMTPSGTTLPVTIPFNYHNTFDYSLGTSYKPNEKWILRAGLQWMNTPSNDRDRGVADPIGSAIVMGLGAHYDQNSILNYDIGYGHSFFKRMPVNLVTPLTIARGHNRTQTNVFGAQVNWNIA